MFKYKKHREIPELASHMRVKVETLQNENFFLILFSNKTVHSTKRPCVTGRNPIGSDEMILLFSV